MSDNVREALRELFVLLILWLTTLGLFAFAAVWQLILGPSHPAVP